MISSCIRMHLEHPCFEFAQLQHSVYKGEQVLAVSADEPKALRPGCSD